MCQTRLLLSFLFKSTRSMMKALLFVLFLSLTVMVGMMVQTVTQELKLYKLTGNMVVENELMRKKEEELSEIKLRVKELKDQLTNAEAQVKDLNVKREKTESSLMSFEEKMQNCNKDKEDSMMKKATVESNITKLKGEREKTKARVDEDLDNLKQKILQRDKELCPFADMTKAEAQALCGVEKETSA